MDHRGVPFCIRPTSEPHIWRWEFRIGDVIRSGTTEARLEALAVRRVQQQINRELRRIAREAEEA